MPDYGPVWTPTVDAGWAPYRDGRWVWEPYWGWTWVSYEPWGWAPYHYGRWFLNGEPLGVVAGSGLRRVSSDLGAGVCLLLRIRRGVSVGVGFGFGWGFGSIGWLPIGPGDYFHPWWGGYRDRFNVVDIHNAFNNHEGFAPLHGGDRFSNLRDVATNDRLRGGVSSVRSEAFGRGGEAPHGINAKEFSQGRMMTGNLPVVPGRESLRASNRPVSSTVAARANTQQRFFTRNAPAGPRESFSDQASRVQTAIQRTGSFRAIGGGVNPGGAGPSQSFRPQGQVSQGQTSEGWNRFGGRPQSGQPQGQPQVQGQNGGQGQFNGRGGRPNYRPPLDMSKPVVNPRSSAGGNGGYAPAYRGAPGYSAPAQRSAPSYSAPPALSAPSYRGAPSSNSGGGGYRGGGGGGARSGGGGGSRGGGGGGSHGGGHR